MRERTTRYVLLGVLQQLKTGSGYEAQRHIAESIGHFWSESFGQIYPELVAMAKDGLIVEVEVRDQDARGRRRYRVTPKGRATLREWLARPAAPQPVRQEALLKLFFGTIAGPAVVAAHLERERTLHTERLAFFNEVAAAVMTDYAEDEDLAYSLMVLRAGQLVEAARLQWVQDCRKLLVAAEDGNPSVIKAARRMSRAGVEQ